MENLYNKKWYKKWWGIILIIVLILIFLFGGIFAIQTYIYYKQIKNNQMQFAVEEFEGEFFNPELLEQRQILETADDPSLGPDDAPITIVEFGDFECPFCRRSYTVIRELESIYRGKIRIIFRDFPIINMHENAMLAHVAANCAHEQGKFWAMHDKIFANQENISKEDLKKYAGQIGLREQVFNSCLNSNKYNKEIVEDLNNGVRLGVGLTPTWFINGFKLEGALTLEQWKELLDAVPIQ